MGFLDSGSGLIIGDFAVESCAQPLLRRKMFCSYPHLSLKGKTRCLALIMSQSCDSGFSPASDMMAKGREI